MNVLVFVTFQTGDRNTPSPRQVKLHALPRVGDFVQLVPGGNYRVARVVFPITVSGDGSWFAAAPHVYLALILDPP